MKKNIASRLGREDRDLRHLIEPSVIIGDIHGCWFTLVKLLHEIGIDPFSGAELLVSVGDLHDKGGQRADTSSGASAAGSVRVLRWAMEQTLSGRLVVVDSNHGQALVRRITSNAKAKPAVEETFNEIMAQEDSKTFKEEVRKFLADRPSFVRLSGGPRNEIVVAHAAVAERLLTLRKLRSEEERFSILAREFRWTGTGNAVVGHIRTSTPTRTVTTAGDLLRIDTGCGEEGGKLSAWLPKSDSFISVSMDPRDLRK